MVNQQQQQQQPQQQPPLQQQQPQVQQAMQVDGNNQRININQAEARRVLEHRLIFGRITTMQKQDIIHTLTLLGQYDTLNDEAKREVDLKLAYHWGSVTGGRNSGMFKTVMKHS